MSLETNKSVPLSITLTDAENNNNKNKNNENKNNLNLNQLNRDMFEFKYVIGKGGFGKVWQVIYKKTKAKYALKEMSKTKIIDKKSQKFINNELTLLKKLRNDFIVNIYYAFQDKDNLYLVIDFLSGGDLRYHVSRYHSFSEEQTRFFISCIIQGLSHIHSNNIIHRDIKPENLVLDSRGYVRITDFGIAKENEKDNSSENSGTPGYMSPEVILKKNHTFTTDFFAIGVIGYEFMKGKRPFVGNRAEIKEKMSDEKYFEENIKIKNSDKIFKKGWSLDSGDFINKLLEINMNKRLGNKYGIKELKQHQWLKYYLWDDIENKTLESPFIPDLDRDNFDKDYCKDNDIITEKTKKRYEKIILSTQYKIAFVDFYYNKDTIKEEKKKNLYDKKIVIDSNNININKNRILKGSQSNKNKNRMILDTKKLDFESSVEQIKNKIQKNDEIIKKIINDNSNTENVLNKNLNNNNNNALQITNYKNKNKDEIYIKKLLVKNSIKRDNNNNNKNFHSPSPNRQYNYSFSPKLSSKNIYNKYYKDSFSNSNLKSYNNINQNNILNINIINIKNKNTFTNSNTPLIKNNNNLIYKKINPKKKISFSNGKTKQIKSGFDFNFEKFIFKNKHIRDFFFKKVYSPFHKSKFG